MVQVDKASDARKTVLTPIPRCRAIRFHPHPSARRVATATLFTKTGGRPRRFPFARAFRIRNPSNEDWQRIKGQLLAGAWKVSSDGGWWEQDGLRRTFEKQKEFSDKQRQRAEVRWRRSDVAGVPKPCRTDAGKMPQTMPEGCFAVAVTTSKERVAPGTQEEFSPLEYARRFWEEIGIPVTSSTLTTAAQAITMIAEREECGLEVACQRVLERAEVDRRRGKKINAFWFMDGCHVAKLDTTIQPVPEANSLAARNRRERE